MNNKNTNISLIQLIKSGKISTNIEITNVLAKKDINIYVRKYLEKSPDYKSIKNEIDKAQKEYQSGKKEEGFSRQKLESLYKVEEDFIVNVLLLAGLFSKIEIRTKRLQEAIQLFESGKIYKADKVLKTADLINDKFNLIVYVEYKEARLKFLENEL